MDEEVKNKGFAGLSSLTSEIEDYVSTDDEAEKQILIHPRLCSGT